MLYVCNGSESQGVSAHCGDPTPFPSREQGLRDTAVHGGPPEPQGHLTELSASYALTELKVSLRVLELWNQQGWAEQREKKKCMSLSKRDSGREGWT